MKKVIFLIAVISCLVASAQTADDNVIITQLTATYTLKEKNSELSSVKSVISTTFLAQRANTSVLDLSFYNSEITIDKASAPGARPQYRAWEDDDMFYTGSRVCYLAIPLTKGKEVKSVMERTYKSPEQFCEVVMAEPYFTRKADYKVIVPAALVSKIKIEAMRLPQGVELMTTRASDGSMTYGVTLTDREGFTREAHSPSASVSAPKLVISMFADFNELYSFMRSKVMPDEPTAEVKAKAEEITAGLTDPIDKAQAIASWVRQNIRYIAVEHGEYGFRPDAAASVLQKRYGDCKGSASLIKGMLRSVGVDGRLVWIGTSSEIDTDWTTSPNVGSGNHMIAAAVLPDTIVYLDGTASYCPRGYYPASIAGQETLVEDGENVIVGRVPRITADDNTYYFAARYRVDGSDIAGTVEHILTGSFRYSFENSLNGRDAMRRDDFLRAYITVGTRTTDCSAMDVNEGAPNDTVTTLRADVVEKKAVTAAGDKLYVDLRPLRNITTRPVSEKNRKAAIRSGRFRMLAKVILELPEGYTADSASLEPTIIKNPWFDGFVTYELTPEGLECLADVVTLRVGADASEVKQWNKALREVLAASTKQATLVKNKN